MHAVLKSEKSSINYKQLGKLLLEYSGRIEDNASKVSYHLLSQINMY